MAESIIYFIFLLMFCIFDIRDMVKKKFKKEIVPYLVFVVFAGCVGLMFYKNPYGNSISHVFIRIFNVQG